MNVYKPLVGAILAAGLLSGPAFAENKISACELTDTGGVDDRSFNETAWHGMQRAKKELGIGAKVVESPSEVDFEPNMTSVLGGKCDVIVTVGFLWGKATEKFAKANPGQKFSIVDYAYTPQLSNVRSQTFATDEAAFLAGYLSAGMTKTGTIGVFGGMNIPPVTIFMDGYVRGIRYYNAVKKASVNVLGWDPDKKQGLFVNNFRSLDDGRTFAQNLYDEGADIILPVAGTVGLGSAALADELGPDKLKILGVDADMYLTNQKLGRVYLTSIMKRMDNTTFEVLKDAKDGKFAGGEQLGTLANGGVDIAPFHDMENQVPDDLKTELAEVRAQIVSGKLSVK
ncbi:BMP family ABC transporter substrate-binding protein (plasmid) [Rhizobium sp. CB3060]|uniref:BMP family lipoprotein n=1 Tax=Rhizobium sp. CB3060 TaxID=3138255 RepID=UPI0021A44CED|nr:BMP family ABC transporter substrate-binding protein [Rhizobium tropici]UWU25502.1 BMP family ABC transporter substrate-binding protein [Rhizobium tropici]